MTCVVGDAKGQHVLPGTQRRPTQEGGFSRQKSCSVNDQILPISVHDRRQQYRVGDDWMAHLLLDRDGEHYAVWSHGLFHTLHPYFSANVGTFRHSTETTLLQVSLSLLILSFVRLVL